MNTCFFQLIDVSDKGNELLDLVGSIANGNFTSDRIFLTSIN